MTRGVVKAGNAVVPTDAACVGLVTGTALTDGSDTMFMVHASAKPAKQAARKCRRHALSDDKVKPPIIQSASALEVEVYLDRSLTGDCLDQCRKSSEVTVVR